MKRIITFTICHWLFATSYCQGYENTILFGYSGGNMSPNDDQFGMNIITFTNGRLEITDDQNISAFFNDTDAAISDTNGQLLFYFNGIDIFDKSHNVMQNGGLINEYNETGYDLPQGGIIIPYPGKDNKYILFHVKEGFINIPGWGSGGQGCFYSIIDMTLNNGLGKVIQKKVPIVIDTIDYGKLAVTRHANGRDWWLAVPEMKNNRFYMILIDPFGIHNLGFQTVGQQRSRGIGQAFFSPDGTKYVLQNAIGGWEGYYVDIYDFDRCSGLFSNHEEMHFVDTMIARGVIISPNSRWLYVSGADKLFKYDLWVDSVALTREIIDIYEPFNDPFTTYFHRGFLAPDNKIYIITSSGSRALHVIHKPDEPGIECAFEQHGIRLPCYNSSSLPTFADFRLGPLDGSPCDTLGINNVPVAWWRYEQDTVNPLLVEFADLSYHEPVSWSWDLADISGSSSERHPVHQFNSTGVYQVCLTVSNAFGSDSHCKTLYLGVSAQDNQVLQSQIRVAPNPFRNQVSVALSVNLKKPLFRLFTGMGQLVSEQPLLTGLTDVYTNALPPGLYVWEITADNKKIKSGKCIKVAKD